MKKALILVGVVFVILTIFEILSSYAVFETNVDQESNLKVAKWNIYVNDYDLNNTNNTFFVDDITYINNEGVSADKFAPGVTGEFIIVIDPKDTEVSFEYELMIDLSDNAYKQIQIDSVEGINGTVITKQDNIYKNVIKLADIKKGKKDMIKVTFSWINDDANNESDSSLGLTEGSTFEIPISIKFKQYM